MSQRFDVNCSILFTELPLLARPAAARDAGFDAIELWWPFAEPVPTDGAVDTLLAAVSDAGVQLVGLNFFAGEMAAGERGVLSHPGRENDFRNNVAVVVAIAKATGCQVFNALYGNRLDGVDPARQDEAAAENLAYAAGEMAAVGGTVVVEPISGVAAYPLKTAADAMAVVDAAHTRGHGNVRLLADVYHLSVNGDDVGTAIADHADDIGHVQIADAPGRHQPGTGDLDIGGYLDRLAGAGYSGWIGLEYVPTGPSAASFDWLPGQQRERRKGA